MVHGPGQGGRGGATPASVPTSRRPRTAPPGVLPGALAVLLTLAALLLAAPAPANAASGHCRGHVVRTLTFMSGRTTVYRSGSSLCAQTKARSSRTRTTMSVSLQARGGRPALKKARYTGRTPPLTVHAGHRAVRVTGSVGKSSARSGWFGG